MAEYGAKSRKCRWCGTSGKGWDCGTDACVPQPIRDAIMRWKADFGWTWKSKLTDAWASGDYQGATEEDECLLQQARNNWGYRCLTGPNNVPREI